MRHSYIPFIIIAGIALFSCARVSEIEKPSGEQKGTYTYTISASSQGTKTSYDAEGTFSWSAGDAISVLFHKDDDNKFFTLTTSDSGPLASFTGEIEKGYEIGASDGDELDKKIWALFPASDNHSYTEGSNPTFYVQPEVDFTTRESANIPMYDLVPSIEGTELYFKILTSNYKFILNVSDSNVEKVRVVTYNQTTYGLSGAWPIHNDKYINYAYASPGSANSTLTYTCNVVDGKAEFYLSCRYWGTFQPSMSIYDADRDYLLATLDATQEVTPTSFTKIQPITIDVTAETFIPAITIDGDMSDWDPSNNSALTASNYRAETPDGTYWKEFKVAYDLEYVYFYAKRNYNLELWNADGTESSGYFWFKFDMDNDGVYDKVFYVRPFTVGVTPKGFVSNPSAHDASGTASSSFTMACAGTYDESIVEIEFSVLRSDLGIAKNDVIYGINSNANKSAGNINITESLTISK